MPRRKSRREYATWIKPRPPPAPDMGFPEGAELTLRAGGISCDRELARCEEGREQGRKDEQSIHHSRRAQTQQQSTLSGES